MIDALIRDSRDRVDLADPGAQSRLYALAESLESLSAAGEVDVLQPRSQAPLEFRLARMLARSRVALARVQAPISLGIVMAMWGEQNRLRPRAPDNPNGEDSLRFKLDQLDWACRDSSVSWTLYAVDDGCPHHSAAIAADIVSAHARASRVRVKSLSEALPASHGPLAGLKDVDQSRKGGAIILGASQALDDGVDAVIYTDADNSVHLGQIGLLVEPFVCKRARIVLGNRKHPDAVLVKQEARWGVGIKLLRHMQRMVGEAIFSRGILDTQAAFKLFEREVLRQLLDRRTVFDFSFDTDWISGAIALGEAFETVPFAFIDSAAESASITQGPMTTWECLLKGLAHQVRAHGVAHNEEMCRVLDEEVRGAPDLELLIDRLPPQLADAGDERLGDPAVMSPAEIAAWIRQCRREADEASG